MGSTSNSINDIDIIWQSMRDKSTSSHAIKGIKQLWESTPSPTFAKCPLTKKDATKNKNRSIDKIQHVEATITNSSLDMHVVTDNTSVRKNDESAPHSLLPPSMIGDSDDETVVEESDASSGTGKESTSSFGLHNAYESVPMRFDRFVSTLQSPSQNDRMKGLQNMRLAIDSLVKNVTNIPPPLDFPPPYDVSRICLTHKNHGALVSDLAHGKNAPAWSSWQQARKPLLSQFPHQGNIENLERSDTESSAPQCEADYCKVVDGYHDEKSSSAILDQLQCIIDACGSAIFRRFSDMSEKCRLESILSVQLLCLAGIDIGKHLAYLISAIISRYPRVAFDTDMQIFVHDLDDNEFFKRGGATRRQDQINTSSAGSYAIKVGEPSEEIRLALCELLSCILRRFIFDNNSSILGAYFTDILMALQTNLQDPFPKLKIAASKLIVQMLRVPEWESGAKIFATALARAAIPHMRHQNSNVRISSIQLFEAAVSVPDREKIKGAGTDAIADLLGFREENVLPIAAFYKSECNMMINTLPGLIMDQSARVRLCCCQMLSFFITSLPDRYGYQQRLLPYILSFYTDDQDDVRRCALDAVEICGQHYEAEHHEDVVERRQYGVDGDERSNHKDQLPAPFLTRPRLGTRLFVRSNTKRFFSVLLGELRSWISKTRVQSAKLVRILVIYCEEHLTMDFYNTISSIVKAIQMAQEDDEERDHTLLDLLTSILKFCGRYVDPDTYIELLLPRVLGNVESATTFSDGCIHSERSRIANATALRAMITGSLPSQLVPHSINLMESLSSDKVLGMFTGTTMKIECLKLLVILLERIKVQGTSTTAHFKSDTSLKCRASLVQLISECGDTVIIDLATRGKSALS